MDIADLLQSPSRLDDADQALLKRMLADPDIDPDEEDEQGDTPLGLACYLDQVEAVRLLLQSGRVDVNHAGAGGHTPLMQACWAGCWSAVDELLDRGADACARNAYGRTAFFYAVAGNQMEVLDRLFEHARSGTRIEYTLPAPSAELDGNVSFVVFPSEETKRLVSERLRELGVDVDSLDWLKETPPLDGDAEELRAACRQGDLQRLEELLDGEMRTDISAGDANGVTPLMEACAYGHAEVAIELLNAGAEPNAVDAWGRTALYYACAEGHARVVTKL
ncbi:ankyrin repeat-containing domain protein, partial [Hyaloraphidium curvatum]